MRPLKAVISGIAAAVVILSLGSCPSPSGGPERTQAQVLVRQEERLLASGDTIFFGSAVVNTTKDVVVTIENSGDGELQLSGGEPVTLSGPDGGCFSVVAPPAPAVAAGGSTSFTLRFSAPASPAVLSASAGFTCNDPDRGDWTLTVSAEATAAAAPEIHLLNPYGAPVADGGGYDFGWAVIDTTVEATFTIQNLGSAGLTLGGAARVAVEGADAAMFVVTAQPDSPVPPSGDTAFTVRFAPTSAGPRNAALRIDNDDGDESPYDIALSGSCSAPEMDVKQGAAAIACGGGSYAFAATVVGAAEEVDLSILNPGNAPLHLSGSPRVALVGPDAGQFTVLIQPAATVQPVTGRNDFRLRFNPTSAGLKSAEVRIDNDDPDENPYTFAVEGEGLEAPPPAPTGLRVVFITADSILLAWDPAPRAATYRLQWSADGVSGWADTPGGAALAGTSHTHGGLSVGATVHYRVAAANAGGASGWSGVIAATIASVTAPAAPTIITAEGAFNPASLEWSAPATWGTGAGPCTYSLLIDSAVRATGLAATVTSYPLTGMAAGAHTFQVFANNGSLATPSELTSFIIFYP